MKIGQKFFLAKKYFRTNYNFKFVNSVHKMNILSLKMDLQSPFQVNREHIRKTLKKGNNSAKNWKFTKSEKTPGSIHEMNLCAKFHNSSFICVVRINSQKSKWPKFKFHENRPKKIFDQKIFSEQLQLLDCEQCAKKEHPITQNGLTIPLSS